MNTPVVLNNRYQLEEHQATGGMAEVYRAYDRMLERHVAVKILRPELSSDPQFRERFRQEARAAANLSHPNIVTIHDIGLDGGQLYIVMEYVAGIDLKTLLRQRGRLPTAEAIGLVIQACSGIGHAHRAGLVHCDVKPQNMLVKQDHVLKVVDFGIARAMTTISPHEKSKIIWGSPLYLSPEQASGKAPSPASDVYSLGVVLYELLIGSLPFNGNTSESILQKHINEPPPSPRRFNPEIPLPVEEVILTSLSKNPTGRYPNASQMGLLLSNILKQPQLFDRPAPLPASALRQPAASPLPAATASEPARPAKRNLGIDWILWLLVFFVVVAVGGLIPFWIWVYYMLFPPI
jgi:serine/threonine-protein kinase